MIQLQFIPVFLADLSGLAWSLLNFLSGVVLSGISVFTLFITAVTRKADSLKFSQTDGFRAGIIMGISGLVHCVLAFIVEGMSRSQKVQLDESVGPVLVISFMLNVILIIVWNKRHRPAKVGQKNEQEWF